MGIRNYLLELQMVLVKITLSDWHFLFFEPSLQSHTCHVCHCSQRCAGAQHFDTFETISGSSSGSRSGSGLTLGMRRKSRMIVDCFHCEGKSPRHLALFHVRELKKWIKKCKNSGSPPQLQGSHDQIIKMEGLCHGRRTSSLRCN